MSTRTVRADGQGRDRGAMTSPRPDANTNPMKGTYLSRRHMEGMDREPAFPPKTPWSFGRCPACSRKVPLVAIGARPNWKCGYCYLEEGRVNG
jgi:hypothetical protein